MLSFGFAVCVPPNSARLFSAYRSSASSMDGFPFATSDFAAYKPMEEIINNIGDTADIIKTVKPLYNFKSAE